MKQILIITSKLDFHPNSVIKLLEERNIPFFRLNTEALMVDYEFSWIQKNGKHRLRIKDKHTEKVLDEGSVHSVWYRRPEEPDEMPYHVDEQIDEHNKKEARYYYSRFYVLYSAVIASGNGFSKDKALKVLYIPDEYAIFRDMMSMKLVEQRLVDYRYDCMTLDRGINGETVTMWFDTYLRWRYVHNSKR